MNNYYFNIEIENNKPKSILVDGKETELLELVHTPIWDKVNNVISYAHFLKEYLGIPCSGYVNATNYDGFMLDVKNKMIEKRTSNSQNKAQKKEC
jgi:hypothetical protein